TCGATFYAPRQAWVDWVKWGEGSWENDDFEIKPEDIFWSDGFEGIEDPDTEETVFFDDFEIVDKAEGYIISELIKPVPGDIISKLSEWSALWTKENIYHNTDISYSILDENESLICNVRIYGESIEGENQILSFDLNGTPCDIDSGNYRAVKLRADLITRTPYKTPSLDYWKITYLADLTPPYVDISRSPTDVYKNDDLTLTSTAYDVDPNQTGISSHKIEYRINGGEWQTAGQWSEGGTHSAIVDSSEYNTDDVVEYKATAWDGVYNKSETPIESFTVLNHPPVAGMSCENACCGYSCEETYPLNGGSPSPVHELPGCECNGIWTTYNGDGVVFKIHNDSVDLDGDIDISTSTWSIIGSSISYVYKGKYDMTMPKIGISPGNYTIELEVEDNDGATSSVSHPITLKQDIIAGFECCLSDSINPSDWQACEDINPSQGDIVYFRDNLLTPHENSSPSDTSSIVSRKWRKKVSGSWIEINLNSSFVTTTVDEISNDILLIVKDNTPGAPPGREGCVTHRISTGFTFPKYKEISPFISLRDVDISSAIGFFRNIFEI
ncbi:MAG: hypothetical protein U9P88_00535, partial [Patescibacteria group bacterium]|nr:hypothetical protein [Patescibacteria group bacterium]